MADNEVQIDSLTIAVEESAGNAAKNLSSLTSGLKKLQKVLSSLNVGSAVAQFDSLSSALNSISNTSGDKITALASSLLDLKSVGKVSVSVPKSLSNQINALGTSLNGITESSIKRLSGLGAALKNLGVVQMPKISASIGRQLSTIVAAANELQGVDLSKLSALADALRPLSDLGRAQLTSFINQLGKLPELSRQLDAVDIEKFASQVERLAAAMKPLADEMEKISQGFSKFPMRIQKFITNNEKATGSAKTATSNWSKFFDVLTNGSKKSESKLSKLAKSLLSVAAFRATVSKLEGALDSANKYIEDLNLFNVSMGEFTEEGQKYAETVGESYGIDPAEFMRMQAVTMDMSKSFGVASDTAFTMSKALTQLTYDISSLYNLNIEEAASKVQSALAGEIEPIRRLGKDLSVANLKLLATELGINANVDSMNQAEKAMLRTISLLRQSTSAMGDMARTLDQPANQFRVLKAQITLLGRAVGDLLLPIVQKTLPYLIALVKVAQRVVMAFAKLAGFELPKFDYADSTVSDIEKIGDAADDAAASVKKLYTLSFDELNILGSQNSSGSGSGTSAEDLAKLEAELNRLAKIENDAFSAALGEGADKIAESMENWLTKGQGIEKWAEKIRNSMSAIVGYVEQVGDMLGLWDVDADLVTNVKNLAAILITIWGVLKLIEVAEEALAIADLVKKVFGWKDATEQLTDAMSNKNKKLTEQTKDTVAEADAVADLTGATDGATSAVTAFAGAIPLIGISWLENKNVVDSNPLSLTFDTSQVTEGALNVENSTQSILTSIESMSWNAAQMADNLGVALNTATQTYGNSILATADATASQLVSDMSLYGEDLYDAMVSPMQRVDAEYSNIFNNIYQNYVSLMRSMEVSVSSSFSASSASRITSSQRNRVVQRGKYLSKAHADDYDPSYNYGISKSTVKAPTASEVLSNMYKQQWNDISKKIENTGKNFANSLSTVIDKTMDILSKLFGISSAAIGAPAFASGGFPEDGVFYANSHELVGRFSNGRTAVANNAQITEGIRQAVYEAVRAAQNESGRSGGKIELILDKQVVGRAFGDAIDTERRRSGANTKITFSNGGKR